MPQHRIPIFEGLLKEIENKALPFRAPPTLEGNPYVLWDQNCKDLEKFVRKHCCLPSKRERGVGVFLAKWASDKRVAHRAGKRSPQQQQRLENLHYLTKGGKKVVLVWSWNPVDDSQLANCTAVKDYVEATGQLPKRSQNKSLCVWIHKIAKRQLDVRLAPGVKERLLALPPFVELMGEYDDKEQW